MSGRLSRRRTSRWWARARATWRELRGGGRGDGWALAPAPLSGDTLLVFADGDDQVIAIVPPGASLRSDKVDVFADDEEASDLQLDDRPCWRRAVWQDDRNRLALTAPDVVEVVALSALVAEAGAWRHWFRAETERALARMLAAMRPLGTHAPREDLARELQRDVGALLGEAEGAFPEHRWRPAGRRRIPRRERPDVLLDTPAPRDDVPVEKKLVIPPELGGDRPGPASASARRHSNLRR